MKRESISFSINTYYQAREVIEAAKKNKIMPVLHIKHYLIKGFGIDWLINIKKLLEKDFAANSFKLYVDVRFDYGLCILLAKKKIDFIKLRSNTLILKKIKQICKKNRVLLNPSFRIVELSNIKKIHNKICKIYSKG